MEKERVYNPMTSIIVGELYDLPLGSKMLSDLQHVQDCIRASTMGCHDLGLRKFLSYDDKKVIDIIEAEEDRRYLLREG